MSILFKAIILGLLQGLTEFLPVSSSGHLAVVQYVLGFVGSPEDKKFFLDPTLMLFFDVAMHFATLLAILLFFRKKIVDLFRVANRPILIMIIVGSIPAVLVGFFVSRFGVRESFEKSPVLIGFCFLITAALLKLTDYAREQGFEMRTAGLKKPLLVGCGQALSAALLGVSRSGSTVSTGLIAGFKRQDAVVFSFFLAIPAILGAMCMESLKLLKIVKGMTDYGTLHIDAVVAGCVAAFIMSLIAIKLLLVIVQMKKFSLFAYYMLLAAAATFVIAFIYR